MDIRWKGMGIFSLPTRRVRRVLNKVRGSRLESSDISYLSRKWMIQDIQSGSIDF